MIEAGKFKRVAWDGRLVGPLRARVPYDKAAVIRRAQLRLHEPAPLREEAGTGAPSETCSCWMAPTSTTRWSKTAGAGGGKPPPRLTVVSVLSPLYGF